MVKIVLILLAMMPSIDARFYQRNLVNRLSADVKRLRTDLTELKEMNQLRKMNNELRSNLARLDWVTKQLQQENKELTNVTNQLRKEYNELKSNLTGVTELINQLQVPVLFLLISV